jgi:hypothetical protein
MNKELKKALIDAINYHDRTFKKVVQEKPLYNFNNKHIFKKPKPFIDIQSEYVVDMYEDLLTIYYQYNKDVMNRYKLTHRRPLRRSFNITNNHSSGIIVNCDKIELNNLIPSIIYSLIKIGKMDFSIPGIGEIFKLVYEYHSLNKLLATEIFLNYMYGLYKKVLVVNHREMVHEYSINEIFKHYDKILTYIKDIHNKVYYIDTDTIYVKKASKYLKHLNKYSITYEVEKNKKMLFIEKKRILEFNDEWKIIYAKGIRYNM